MAQQVAHEKAQYAMSVKPMGIRNRALEVGCRRKISVVLYSLLLTVPIQDEAAAYWKTCSPHANQQTMKWKT